MIELVFLLEEASAEALLKSLLPRILPDDINARYIPFEGKQDLERQLVRRIRGYQSKNARFVILRDQDSGDCRIIKNTLMAKCSEAGREDALVRIACRELESWYLADLQAVERALRFDGLARKQNKSGFRDPDRQPSPSRILAEIAPYQKISGSRAIGAYLDLENRRSPSFAAFVSGIRCIVTDYTKKL